MFAFLAFLSLLVSAPSSGATPMAPGAPRFAQITSLQGVPTDSTSRDDFMQGIRDVFADEDIPVLRGEGPDTEAQPNRFRLLEGEPADDAWRLMITVGAPPPILGAESKQKGLPPHPRRVGQRRASRGVIVAIETRSPKQAEHGESTIPFRYQLVVPAVATDTTVLFQHPPTGGVLFRWDAAGRAAGLLALEQLHHQSGDLPFDHHVSIAPVIRVGEAP